MSNANQRQSAIKALKAATKALLHGIANPRTRRAYDARLRGFQTWLEESKPVTIDARAVEKYLGYLALQGKETATINQSLAAIRKLADVDSQYAIFRTIKTRKGVTDSGAETPQGSVLTKEQGRTLINAKVKTLREKRDRALIAVLLGCGLKLKEITSLTFEQIERQGGAWMIKLPHRIIPLPAWAKRPIDLYARESGIKQGRVFRKISGEGLSRDAMTENIIYKAVGRYSKKLLDTAISPEDLRRTFANFAREQGASLEQIQELMGHKSMQNTKRLVTAPSKEKRVSIEI